MKLRMYKPLKLYFFSIFFICLVAPFFAQENKNSTIENYEKFSASTKEVAFVHLNKSTFIKNESLSFTAYVFDKNKKTALSISKNLYCVIKDTNDKVVKQKLVKLNNGVAHNVFEIDSLFTSGKYIFRAYTNWMQNFNERNYYEHPFKVLDSQSKLIEENNKEFFSLKYYPEGGHLIANAQNTIGIIAKNKKGIGLKNTPGKIIDENGATVTEFKLNQFGIAKAILIPKPNKNYQIEINNQIKNIVEKITDIKPVGINLSVLKLRNNIGITLRTNANTISSIKNNNYELAIHNGERIKIIPVSFDEKLTISKIIESKDLFSGINIVTLFDKKTKSPILERLFFNKEGIRIVKFEELKTKVKPDSLTINLKLNTAVDLEKLQNISVSVLPSQTKSYNFNTSILTQLYLEPYVRGHIQDANYYFSKDSPEIDYNLDNLLITQGWSSYDWKDIFSKSKEEYKYKFEQGINVVANIQGKHKEGFLVYPLKENKTEIFNPKPSEKAFIQTNLFPYEDEFYKVSLLEKNERTSKPKLYIQYYPNKIPELKLKYYETQLTDNYSKEEEVVYNIKNGKQKDIEVLDEVIIKANKEAERIQKIKNRSRGKVRFFDNIDSQGGATLATYLSSRGWIASDLDGILRIVNPQPNSPNNNIPLVILDGVFLDDFGFLAGFSLATVDYIESNKSGIGYGIRGGGGVIKIVTDPVKRLNNVASKSDVASFKFPLTFSSSKKYYTPIYEDYNSSFFKKYGVIDWKPNLKLEKDGRVSFKIQNLNLNSINFYIEGFVNNKEFISEIKTINPF